MVLAAKKVHRLTLASLLTPPLPFIAHQPFWLFSPSDLFHRGFYPANSNLYISLPWCFRICSIFFFLALRLTWSPSYRCASLYTDPIAAISLLSIRSQESRRNNDYCFGDSSDTSIPMSKSSSSNSTTILTSPAETSPMKGLEDINSTIRRNCKYAKAVKS